MGLQSDLQCSARQQRWRYRLHPCHASQPSHAALPSPCPPCQDVEAVQHATAAFNYVSGDGTVPTECALAHGLQAAATVALAVSHRDLVASPAAWGQVLGWLHAPVAAATPGRGHNGGGGGGDQGASGGDGGGGQGTSGGRFGSAEARPAQQAGQQRQGEAVQEEECFWNPLTWQVLLAGGLCI